ncbi:MAG TPA: hypothetical protein VM580_20805, partial [Labilithrix sp.]|nr:hypothetical protein [Labilithrix sp.]
RLDPNFSIVPHGNAERAPLYGATTHLFLPRSFRKRVSAVSQGLGQVTLFRRLGAASALALVRDLLEDSTSSMVNGSAGLFAQYLAKVPRALDVVDGAIGERSFSIRPVVVEVTAASGCSPMPSNGCPRVTQTVSPDGLNAEWAISIRTELSDSFFADPVSVVAVPFQGGVETTAVMSEDYTTFKAATRASLLAAAIEVPLSSPTAPNTSPKRWEATMSLPRTTPLGAYTFFLKKTSGGQTSYELLAQRLSLDTEVSNVSLHGGSSILTGKPVDSQFLAYGGTLGQTAARAWAVRGDDWSKPAYDAFGMPTDWVPPFDPTLLGTGEDASATYLRHARAAADEATNAVKSAVDELLRQQVDDVALTSARRRAAGIAQLEQRALCGDAKPDCDTTTVDDFDLDDYVAGLSCGSGELCASAQSLRSRGVPKAVRLASAVHKHRFDHAPPAFNEYAGGKLQGVLIEQWTALRTLADLVREMSAGVVLHQQQIIAADLDVAQVNASVTFECSEAAREDAIDAGFSFPVPEFTFEGEEPEEDGDRSWSRASLIAQEHACKRAEFA